VGWHFDEGLPDRPTYTPLLHAAAGGRPELVALLLRHGAKADRVDDGRVRSIDKNGAAKYWPSSYCTPLHAAAESM
jgi:hypothetical protein